MATLRVRTIMNFENLLMVWCLADSPSDPAITSLCAKTLYSVTKLPPFQTMEIPEDPETRPP